MMSTQVVAGIAPEIGTVLSGGPWSCNGQEGSYRVLVYAGGFEEVYHHLYVQLITVDAEQHRVIQQKPIVIEETQGLDKVFSDLRIRRQVSGLCSNAVVERKVWRRAINGERTGNIEIQVSPTGAYAMTLESDPLQPSAVARIEISLHGVDRYEYKLRPVRAGKETKTLAIELIPEFCVGHEIIGWDVDIHTISLSAGTRSRNLLEPEGNWHGLQPFMILAQDIDRSTEFNSRRDFWVGAFHFVVEISGGRTKLSTGDPTEPVIESLQLAVEVRLGRGQVE